VEIIGGGGLAVSGPDNRARKSNQDRNFLERTTDEFQENVKRSASAAAVSYTLTGAIILFGLIGYAIDSFRGSSSHGFLIAGLLLGIVVGFVDLARFMWKR
jgi:F0F1-type ATP synthase assembly protein I